MSRILEIADCTNCTAFKSFRDDYFDDMEPSDQGFCKNDKSPYYGNRGAGQGVNGVLNKIA